MQPRGQLWFSLERMCDDFKQYSGLSQKEALEVLIAVLSNMLADTKAELAALGPPTPEAAPATKE